MQVRLWLVQRFVQRITQKIVFHFHTFPQYPYSFALSNSNLETRTFSNCFWKHLIHTSGFWLFHPVQELIYFAKDLSTYGRCSHGMPPFPNDREAKTQKPFLSKLSRRHYFTAHIYCVYFERDGFNEVKVTLWDFFIAPIFFATIGSDVSTLICKFATVLLLCNMGVTQPHKKANVQDHWHHNVYVWVGIIEY